MSEIVVGPRGQMEWDADNKDAVLLATGSWIYRERARNQALDWRDDHLGAAMKLKSSKLASIMRSMNDRGIPIAIPVQRQEGTMNHNEGQYIGVRSSPGSPVFHSLRIDWDAEKGPHYNVMVQAKGFASFKACFRFDPPAGQDGDAWVKKIQAKWSR